MQSGWWTWLSHALPLTLTGEGLFMGQSIKHLMKFNLEEIKQFGDYLDNARKIWTDAKEAAAAKVKAGGH